MLGRVAQGWSEVTNAEPGQRALHAVDKPRAVLDQALALPIGPLGVLFGNRRYAHHAAMAPFAPQPTQEPALQQLGVEPIGLGPAMFPRHGHTRGMDHVRLDPTRRSATYWQVHRNKSLDLWRTRGRTRPLLASTSFPMFLWVGRFSQGQRCTASRGTSGSRRRIPAIPMRKLAMRSS